MAAILTAIGTAALFVTLRLTRRTLDTQVATERPVLIVKDLTVSKAPSATQKHPVALFVQWEVINHGATVGFIDAVNVTVVAGKAQPNVIDENGTTTLRVPLAPGKASKVGKHTEYGLSPGQTNIALGTQRISATGYVRYHNVAQQRWETHFSIMVEIDQEFKSVKCYPVPGNANPIDRKLA
jgi:hypothetical protein